jgi:hypothetical protein
LHHEHADSLLATVSGTDTPRLVRCGCTQDYPVCAASLATG